jgi:tRNA pseudouridine38-40 synthase
VLSRPYSYLFSISYFGARYKGWAKQIGQATIEGKLERVFRYVLGHEDFRFIGSSRTDSGVSCRAGYIQVFMREKTEFEPLLLLLNQNLGGEIRLDSFRETSRDFNLIQSVKQKTYRYYFSDEAGFHPFTSAFQTAVTGINSLGKMNENAQQFLGRHNFKAFCRLSGNKSDYVREVLSVSVFQAESILPEFSKEKSYCFEVTGTGFLYHQVRKMISAIWHFSSQEIQERLERPEDPWEPVPTAPAHGLVLWETILSKESGF